MMRKKKLLIGMIPVFVIGIILHKPMSKIIEVKSNTYGAPANSAFTDENFYKCVIDSYNNENSINLGYIGYDISITDEQLASITKLDAHSCFDKNNISDVSGIEKLVNLKRLWLRSNKISSINLSHNNRLEDLDLYRNQLTSIDLSNNVALKKISLGNNQLTNIDLSHNIALEELYLPDNQIENIDLTNNVNLIKLWLENNLISNIDLSYHSSLIILDLAGNKLINVDLRNNRALTNLNLSGNQLTNIDLSYHSSLIKLDLAGNKLTNVDLRNNRALTNLNLSGNQLTNIDLSNNTSLTNLSLYASKLTNVDLSNNTALLVLLLNNNQLTSLDLSHNVALEKLWLYDNRFTTLDLSKNLELKELLLRDNVFSDGFSIVCYKGKFTDISSNIIEPKFGIKTSSDKINFNIVDLKYNGENISDNYISNYESGEYELEVKYNNAIGSSVYGFFKVIYDVNVKVIEATSDKYIIDENDNYIYTGTDIDNETILQNISLTEYDGVTGNIQNNKYIIKKNDEILKEFDLININSIKYDLSKQYLIGDVADIINNITVANGSVEFSVVKNMFQVKHNDDILQEYGYVNYSSNKYDLSKNYIKVNDYDIQSLLSNINCINCNAYVYDGTNNLITGNFADNYTLRIMYNDEILKEYELKYSVSGVSLNTNNLKLNLDTKKTYQLSANITPTNSENKNVTWESSNSSVATVNENGLVTAIGLGESTITVKTEDGEFTDTCNVTVSEITTYTATFKDGNNTYTSEFEENENIVFKNDLEKTGYKLVGWKYNNQEYKLTDKLPMPGNNIELTSIWELVIPEIKNYESDDNNITGISLKTNVDSLNLGIDSIYQVKVSKHDGSDKTSGLIGTGDKVKIYLDNELVSEYDVIIKGDVTGTGTSTVSDVAKLYQYLKGKVKMDDCYVKAGNVVDSDSTIKVNDVAKLYQFIKGKINSL